MCKISVIIPVYNGETYLAQCLDSIIGQTLKEIEKKRKELGLSQVELAKRIGFSRGYYNMLIHGKKPVSDKLTDQLQNVLQEYRKEKESISL